MKTLLTAALLLTVFLNDSNGQGNGDIAARTPVAFPTYEDVKDISWYYEKNTYENAVNDRSITYEKVIYYSDGLKVVAFLTRPATQNKKLPVVIFNRGSFIRDDIAYVTCAALSKIGEGRIYCNRSGTSSKRRR
jgi:hypothetical protein